MGAGVASALDIEGIVDAACLDSAAPEYVEELASDVEPAAVALAALAQASWPGLALGALAQGPGLALGALAQGLVRGVAWPGKLFVSVFVS